MIAAIQQPLIRVALRNAVLDVNGARALLGAEFDEDDVLAAIDMGEITWAWNVGVKSARRREVRVLAHSVRDYIRRQKMPADQVALMENTCPLVEDVLPLVLPPKSHGKPYIAGIDFADAMLFGSDLLQDLIAQGSLRTVNGSEPRRGRGGSAALRMDSVIHFLKERKIS